MTIEKERKKERRKKERRKKEEGKKEMMTIKTAERKQISLLLSPKLQPVLCSYTS